jgi:segregation and condensation protein A
MRPRDVTRSVVAPAPPAAAPMETSVAFGEKRRPEDATQVRLPAWEGPLGLLLSLVEARRLDVRTVPLGALASAYLEALASLEGDRLANIATFVAVASQLILIKSRELLPRPPAAPTGLPDDEADPEEELRARLLLYRAYRDAGAAIQARATAGAMLVRREPTVAAATARTHAVAPELPRLEVGILVAALERLVVVLPAPETPPEVVRRTITLADRAHLIRAALAEAGPIVLQELLADVTDRVVVAVTFLAMLELVKRREVTVAQDGPWGPIIVTSVPKPVGGTDVTLPGSAPAMYDAFDEHLEDYA